MSRLDLTEDEKRFLSYKWFNLKFKEVEMRIKNMNKELRELSKKCKKREYRKRYSSKYKK